MTKREVNYIIQRIQEEILKCTTKEEADEIMKMLFEVSKNENKKENEKKE